MSSISKQITYRINGSGRGSAFTNRDFLDLGCKNTVDNALWRLAEEGTLRRLKSGLYDFPRVNEKLGGKLSPDLNQVAKAMARKNSLKIQVTGAMAANLLGLSPQVPAKAVYLTDGPSKKIKIYNREIVFKHVEPKRIGMSNSRSGIVLEALKHFGKNSVPENSIAKLQRELSPREKEQLSSDAEKAPIWLQEIVIKITGEHS